MDGKATLRLKSPQHDNTQHLYHENYDLLHCDYSLSKNTDKNGRVDDGIQAGNITVVLPMLPNDKILAWLFDTQRKYNGEITINDAHSESLERIYFEEGRPVNFRFHYEPGEVNNVLLILTINTQRLIIGEAEYVNTRR